MAPRLKVFTWSDGFHAITVATSSRPKALAAWGSGQDLFATGLASELSGGPDYDAALASPGEVIQRGLAIDIDKIGKAPKPKAASGPSTVKREKIARLERELEEADTAHQSAMAEIDRRREALETERAEVERDHATARKKLSAALKKAKA